MIFINLDMIENYKLSSDAVMVYCAIKINGSRDPTVQFLNSVEIGYWLYRRNIDRGEKESIRKGINELVERELITCIEKLGDKKCVYDVSLLYSKEGVKKYTYIYKDDVKSIVNIKSSTLSKNILLYYIYFMYSMIKSGFSEEYIGKISIADKDRLASSCMMGKQKGDNCCKELVENKIIYLIKCHNVYVSNSNARGYKLKNVYSRYKDKDLCGKFVKEHKKEIVTEIQADKLKKLSSAMAKYEWIKRGKEYPEEEVQEIYSIIKAWNEEKEEEWIDANDLDIPIPKFKDLSIFKKYGLE